MKNLTNLYARVETRSGAYKGTYKVKEITGTIIACDVDGKTVDFYLQHGEVKCFCTETGENFRTTFE